MPDLASLAELELHLNLETPTSSDEAELALMLTAASDLVASVIGDRSATTVTETVNVVGGVAILSGIPTGDVIVDGVPVAGVVNRAAGLVTGLSWWPETLAVTYQAGTADVPAAVTLATLIVAAHLWETQRGARPLPMMGGGDAADFAPGIGYAMPNRAKELLSPYMRPAAQIA